jgi:RimJ/RimL family protein N-acetyltransferase
MPAFAGPVVPAGQLNGVAQPTIAVDELLLRPWQAADAPTVVEAYRDPDIQRWHVRTMNEAEASAWVLSWPDRWAAETGAGWAIQAGGVVVGRIGLRTMDLAEGQAEAAYWILPTARGRNVAPRALRAMTEWTFTHVGLHRIDLKHSTRNTGSCRVATKAGYAAEGTAQSSGLHADGWHDMHLHARVNDETQFPQADQGRQPGNGIPR